MMDSINSDVAFIFSNQVGKEWKKESLLHILMLFLKRKLEGQGKKLQIETAKFAKQTAQWITVVEGFNNTLKVFIGYIGSIHWY